MPKQTQLLDRNFLFKNLQARASRQAARATTPTPANRLIRSKPAGQPLTPLSHT